MTLDATLLLRILLNGLTDGASLFLLASGLTLIFGVLRVLNFAHASFFMAAAYLCWTVSTRTGNFWLALVVVPLVLTVLGAITEVVLLRRLYGVHISFQLLLTFGIMLVIKDSVRLIWGEEWKSVNEPPLLSGSVQLLGADYPVYNLAYIAIVAALAVGLYLFLHRTRYGKMIRAAAIDRETANALGINVPLLYTAVFAFGIGLAALMGVFHSPRISLSLDTDVFYIVEAFAVVVIGGLGSVPGALLGALLVGLVNAFGLLILPRFQMAFMYMVMAAVLILRPHGLLGGKEM